MRSLEVIVAVRPLGMERRSVGGRSADVGGCVPFVDVEESLSLLSSSDVPFWSAKSRTQFGSRRTSSGIGSRPSGRGYSSSRC